ncbi:uncharacterized protein N7459_008477 [Penicillium hispanicum]|uniref:uncharacterized protein n=1 Tax=Penicillium hispanicum TaxID=1080232 RepID=UPI0025415940|nr:uncharacterized protein N7459_008477 [Penicillium hispanicum]KAJ5574050.1 hypothetical protein N7459_008477 [Penicillium hispanicum]
MSKNGPDNAARSFEIFSSLRYDPELPAAAARSQNGYPEPLQSPYYLLAYHRDRLIASARHFEWDQALVWLQRDLRSFEDFLDGSIPDRDKSWRMKVVVDCNGIGTIEIYPTPVIDPINLLGPSLHMKPGSPVWRVYVDTQSTVPSGFTTHKTTARDEYTAARMRAGIKSPAETAEVLIVNPSGEIMEGSITTPYFRRRAALPERSESTPAWITPPLTSGGNAGTSRRYALVQNFCAEQAITAAELVDGEECWLSNGVRGFMRGVIMMNQQPSK